jgi:hypothetical protein
MHDHPAAGKLGRTRACLWARVDELYAMAEWTDEEAREFNALVLDLMALEDRSVQIILTRLTRRKRVAERAKKGAAHAVS